jgi:hypothetical protein
MQLGFSGFPVARAPLSAHDIVLVMGLVFLAMLFVPLMMRRFFDPTPLPMNVRVLVMVPIIYAIAIVAAVYPKSVWPFASRQPGGRRPVAAYALSGVVAALASFVVSLLFRFSFDSQGNVFEALATPGAFLKAWNTSVERWPWLMKTFFATIAIAWAADDHPAGDANEPAWLRWVEAAVLAAVFAVLQWTVVQFLVPNMPPDAAERLLRHLPRMLVTASFIGAGIGWLVPSLYRARGRPRGQREPSTTAQALT